MKKRFGSTPAADADVSVGIQETQLLGGQHPVGENQIVDERLLWMGCRRFLGDDVDGGIGGPVSQQKNAASAIAAPTVMTNVRIFMPFPRIRAPYRSPRSARPAVIAGTVDRIMFQPSRTRRATSSAEGAVIAQATLCVLHAFSTC